MPTVDGQKTDMTTAVIVAIIRLTTLAVVGVIVYHFIVKWW